MKGLFYQLKSVGKDKFCIMSFLLPVVVAIALNISDSIDLSSLGEYYFCVVDGEVTDETRRWLSGYGDVTVCQTREEWLSTIREPSTNVIGVEMDKEGINIQTLEQSDVLAGIKHIFMAMTLIVAMFMGCTFNAMNIISEKEDGVALINEILPMTSGQYVVQKIFIGFVFGCLSAVVMAAVCFRLSPAGGTAVGKDMVILAVHCAVWFLLYFLYPDTGRNSH